MKLVTWFWLELYKQKKGWIWLFLLIIPAGTTLAMFLDFSIRYDYLFDTAQPGYSSWDLLLLENHRILGSGNISTDVYRDYLCFTLSSGRNPK